MTRVTFGRTSNAIGPGTDAWGAEESLWVFLSFFSWLSFVIFRFSFVPFVMKEVALDSVEIARASDEVAEQSRVVHQFACDQVSDGAFAFQHPVHA